MSVGPNWKTPISPSAAGESVRDSTNQLWARLSPRCRSVRRAGRKRRSDNRGGRTRATPRERAIVARSIGRGLCLRRRVLNFGRAARKRGRCLHLAHCRRPSRQRAVRNYKRGYGGPGPPSERAGVRYRSPWRRGRRLRPRLAGQDEGDRAVAGDRARDIDSGQSTGLNGFEPGRHTMDVQRAAAVRHATSRQPLRGRHSRK